MVERSYPSPEVRGGGREEQPTFKERWLRGRRRAERSYPTFRRGDLVQGKKQWLRFAGAAVKKPQVQGKRNPSKAVGLARGHQRADN